MPDPIQPSSPPPSLSPQTPLYAITPGDGYTMILPQPASRNVIAPDEPYLLGLCILRGQPPRDVHQDYQMLTQGDLFIYSYRAAVAVYHLGVVHHLVPYVDILGRAEPKP